ncbi:MAG TPA: tRNA (adenosine(37)-N6)-dimethylallyltransferase MiaA [Gammaproteobacteria bacterium]|nr:tRNA (adenosine(37)-N6)-dimethylallyltransferase MiaA [Gammaproteobacteria bacterium]
MASSPVVFLMGPTASGKTELAVRLVRERPFEIVSVDSGMIYRGMDIGTAKPSAEVLAVAPHRLIDILDPSEAYSAARFRADALREMADIRARGRVPLLVGGTMLYFRALERGLATLPGRDPAVRAELDARAAREGWAVLHAELARVDPAAAARIHPNDPQRIQRALEVYLLTGMPLTALQERRAAEAFPYRALKLALVPQDRAVLHDRIAARFRSMMAAGFLEEVRRLRDRGDLTLAHPAMRAVGYRQLWEHLDGRYGLEEAVSRGIYATRQFAKRQLTWLRAMEDVRWFEADDPAVFERVLAWLDEHLRLPREPGEAC